MGSDVFRLDVNFEEIKEGHLHLRDVFFSPLVAKQYGGIDPLIRGMLYHTAQAVDTKVSTVISQ